MLTDIAHLDKALNCKKSAKSKTFKLMYVKSLETFLKQEVSVLILLDVLAKLEKYFFYLFNILFQNKYYIMFINRWKGKQIEEKLCCTCVWKDWYRTIWAATG